MAGYSGRPLLQKLGIREGDRVLLRNPPDRLPEELSRYVNARPKKNLDVVLLFTDSNSGFMAEIIPLVKAIRVDGMIWIAWPKKSSGLKTDLTEDVIRDQVLRTHLVDVKVCAIDETWSGLKLVIRKQYRAAHAAKSSSELKALSRAQET